jgi:hypothetical protein
MAKEHELAAETHRTDQERNEKGDNPSGNWHAQRALENADRAYELAKEDENKSGQIGSLEMSTRYNDGSHYENHQRAAELHDNAAHAHRSAAETHEKQDHETGHELSRQALENSQKPSEETGQAHGKPVNEHGIVLFGHADIAARAHELWEARGCPDGSPETDWFQAARELRGRA